MASSRGPGVRPGQLGRSILRPYGSRICWKMLVSPGDLLRCEHHADDSRKAPASPTGSGASRGRPVQEQATRPGWVELVLVAVFVAVVMADPGHGARESGFVAAFGGHIDEVVRAQEDVEAAGVGGVGVEDFAGFVFVENA
jgi:hypothetical protein